MSSSHGPHPTSTNISGHKAPSPVADALRKQGIEEIATGIVSVCIVGDLGPALPYLASVGIYSVSQWKNIRAVIVDDTSYTKIAAGCPTSVVRRAADQKVILVKSTEMVKTGDFRLVVQSGRNPVLAVVGSVPLDKLNLVDKSTSSDPPTNPPIVIPDV
jgi:hypothetical protein